VQRPIYQTLAEHGNDFMDSDVSLRIAYRPDSGFFVQIKRAVCGYLLQFAGNMPDMIVDDES
jgi:hypothetical protein